MSEENIAVVREAFEALGRDGLDAWIAYLADDMDHRAIVGAPDDRGPMHGKAEVKAYLQEWFDMFDDFKIEPQEMFNGGGDNVILVLSFGGRAKLSGVETSQTAAILYTVRDGKIGRGREFATRGEAVAAAAELAE
jgi:ketosteroid isomerase-like protein